MTQVVPFDLVDEALASAGGLQQRVRRLPSRVVVYLLLAGALFTGQGWTRIWSRLTASLSVPLPVPAGSSITAAMRRVGPKPLKALFDLVKGPAATTATQMTRFAGRLVVAIDGTQIALPDTPANLVVFPKAKPGQNGPAGYPMLRLVTLVACGTRTLLDAAFGTDATGELTYAKDLVTTAGTTGALRSGTLLLGDRNFSATTFVSTVASTGADFLIRAKTHSTALKLPILRRLPDGTSLSRIGDVTVRVIEATLTLAPTGADKRPVTH
ncbi:MULTISPECIES: transposase domain-containing protein [unclassified Streptomyces]|uniref:transposase domain-containing protein n=1 Tax=unclassified Streptomyces TaxID=2593676 RepID=UPI0013681C76|nr:MULTISPECIES: transposase domain-containing protein [unclassified Streptomyces]MYS32587.1 transposase [Streptomyces sp. SID4920]MYX64247.1 transposase [Streptomyces sp. SID8373]